MLYISESQVKPIAKPLEKVKSVQAPAAEPHKVPIVKPPKPSIYFLLTVLVVHKTSHPKNYPKPVQHDDSFSRMHSFHCDIHDPILNALPIPETMMNVSEPVQVYP